MRSQVMQKSGGHNTTINNFKQLRTGGSLCTLSKYGVVSLQRTILCAYPSFNLFSLSRFAPALQLPLQSLFVFTASFILISTTYVCFQHIFTFQPYIPLCNIATTISQSHLFPSVLDSAKLRFSSPSSFYFASDLAPCC